LEICSGNFCRALELLEKWIRFNPKTQEKTLLGNIERFESVLHTFGELCSGEKIFSMLHNHRGILNKLLTSKVELLCSSLQFFLKGKPAKLLSFECKSELLHSRLDEFYKINRKLEEDSREFVELVINRGNVFEDSYCQIGIALAPADLIKQLLVRFHGEQGEDLGGLTREWFRIMSEEFFNPNFALFSVTPEGTYLPNPASEINSDHLSYFKFCGHVIGMAIFHHQVLGVSFTRSLYKQLLGYQASFEDLERMDPQMYSGLKKILSEPGADMLCMNFVVPTALSSAFGDCAETIELVEGGAELEVTDENKSHFVDLIVKHKLIHSIAAQVDQLRCGLYDIIPLEFLLGFDEYELELLISGLPWIDVEDWEKHTVYFGYRNDSEQIIWFWRVVRALSQEDLCRLLQFTTGSSRVPPDGFQSLRGAGNTIQLFSIQYENSNRLPSAHTCFNQIVLPHYKSEKQLQEMLLTAISEGAGFSII